MVDKKNKIYIRKSVANQANIDFTTMSYTPPSFPKSHVTTTHTMPVIKDQKLTEISLDKYGPPGVIIDQNLQIIHFHGQTGPYIEPTTGSASLNLLKMARQELLPELRSAAYQAIKEHCSVRKERIHMLVNKDSYLNLQILPLPASKDTFTRNYLVLFEPSTEKPTQQTGLQPKQIAKTPRIYALKY